MSETSHNNHDTSVTAPPGTPEYQQQFERQTLAAADLTLRVRIVRIACGLFGLLFLAVTIIGVTEAISDWNRLRVSACLAVGFAIATVEFFSVAIRGKLMYLRFLLSGIRREQTKKHW